MRKNSQILLLATAATLSCMPAHAGTRQTGGNKGIVPAPSPQEGPYVRLDAGASFISGADAHLDLPLGQSVSGKAKFKTGFVYGGALGYNFGEIAVEAELDNTHNQSNDFSNISLSFRQTTLLGNVVWMPKYDGVTFLLGGGLGAQFQDSNFTGLSSTATNVIVAGDTFTYNYSKKSDTAFLGQVKAGVSVPLDDRWSFDAAYKLRFVAESDLADGSATYKAAPAAATTAYSSKLTLDSHLSHLLTAGFSYKF